MITLRARSAKAGEIVATLIGGCFLIIVAFLLIFYPPQLLGMDIFSPPSSISQTSETNVVTETQVEPVEPEPATIAEVEVFSLDDAVDDLEKSGCIVTIVTQIEGFSNQAGMLLDYPDFKKIAVKQEIVFQYTQGEYGILVIPYENTFIVWIPDDAEIEEEQGFEKLEIQTGYAEYDAVSTSWRVTLQLKNSGSKSTILNSVFINDVICLEENYGISSSPNNGWGTSISQSGDELEPGQSTTIYLYIDVGYNHLTSGTTINIKIHSSGDMDYIKLIRLP